MEILAWLQANAEQIAAVLALLVMVGEVAWVIAHPDHDHANEKSI